MRFITDDEPSGVSDAGVPLEYRYYVSVVDDERWAVLAGPYGTREEAVTHVNEAKDRARDVDQRAHWYGYGVCRQDTRAIGLKARFGIME